MILTVEELFSLVKAKFDLTERELEILSFYEQHYGHLFEELQRQKEFNRQMKEGWIRRDIVIGKLDEAMASPEQIAEDTRLVGGFVSSLDLNETDEQIINRAIALIEKKKPNS